MTTQPDREHMHPSDQSAQRTLADRIEKRRKDKDFQTRLHDAVERNQEALELLAK